jgi:hypothetical protein
MIFHNDTLLIIKILIIFQMNVYIFFSHRVMVGVIALIELLSEVALFCLLYVFVLSHSLVRFYFIIGLWADE